MLIKNKLLIVAISTCSIFHHCYVQPPIIKNIKQSVKVDLIEKELSKLEKEFAQTINYLTEYKDSLKKEKIEEISQKIKLKKDQIRKQFSLFLSFINNNNVDINEISFKKKLFVDLNQIIASTLRISLPNEKYILPDFPDYVYL